MCPRRSRLYCSATSAPFSRPPRPVYGFYSGHFGAARCRSRFGGLGGFEEHAVAVRAAVPSDTDFFGGRRASAAALSSRSDVCVDMDSGLVNVKVG